jgi:hypothetical protein
VAYAGSRVRDGENLYHFKFTHDFDYPETLLYKFTKGDWSEVEIDSNGNRTENRSTTKHRNTRRTCGTLEKELPFKQNYLPQVLLISDEFEIPHRTRKYGRYFLTIMMIQRKDTL